MGGGNLWAQTDVTSTYITNADFSGTYARFLDINTDRGVEKPLGWSVEWYQDNSDKNGMTYVAESMTQDSKTWSAKSGKSYFARMAWGNATLYLRQTLQNLRPGSYTLSFSATAHSTNASNVVQVAVAGQTQTIASGSVSNENGTWTDYSISFTITESTPYATIEYKAVRAGNLLKVGIDEFTLTYDGSSYYSTILTKAQSLYDDNADWAENGLADLSTAITNNSGKETIADKNAAIVALEEAMATFKAANSVDMTAKITNPNFDSNISGWTVTGGDGNAYQHQTSSQTNFTGGFLEKWRNGWNGGYNQADFNVSQQLTDLPNGEYTIKAYILAQMQGGKETLGNDYKNKKHGGPYYIDDEKGVWFYASSGDNTANTWANSFNPNFGDTSGGVLRSATVNVTNGTLTIGFKGIGSTSGGTSLGTYANWIACDTWTLSYFGFDPTTLKAQISDLKNDVQEIIDGDEVPTAVKTSLQSTLTNLVETPETKTILEAAISTLESAISNANATKDAYAKVKALITFVTSEKTNSTGTKTTIEAAISAATTNIETRTTADALEEDYNTLEAARQTYVTSGAQPTEGNVFDYTFKINDAAVTNKSNWNNCGTGSGQQYTGAPDNTYMDCGWNTSTNGRQTVESLPAGYYTLKAATRANTSDITSANIYVNQTDSSKNKSTDTHRDGNTGGTLGNGWSWTEVEFELEATGNVTVGFYGKTTGQGWAGADDFHLYYKGNFVASSEATAILTEVVSGKLNADVAAAQTEAKDAFEAANTVANYNALRTAIDNATTSKAAYTTGKAAIDKANDIMSKTNVYTAEAYTTFSEAVAAAESKYADNSWTDREATTFATSTLGNGWRTTASVDDFLISAWDVEPRTWGDYHVNTWSTTGDSGNPNLVVPAIEYWGDSGSALADKVMTATVAVEPYETYKVSAFISMAKNTTAYGTDATTAPVGVTLQVGDGTATTCTGTRVEETRFFEGTFEATGEADGSGNLTIMIAAASTDASWIMFRDVKYTKQASAEATAEEKAALLAAINAAKENVIGFEKDEYAPYNNKEALATLATAETVYANSTTKPAINGLKDALEAASWTKNSEELNAFYDGTFSTREVQETSKDGTKIPGWTSGNNIRQILKTVASFPGLADATSGTALFAWSGGATYGNDEGYEMPLKANTIYKFSVKVAGWNSETRGNITVSVLNGSDGMAATVIGKAAQAISEGMNELDILFVTGDEGNYIFSISSANNIVFTDVELKRAASQTLTLPSATKYAAGTYPTVTLDRTFSADKWNTLCAPFDFAKSSFAEVKVLNSVTESGDDVNMTFADAEETVAAGTPCLVKAASDGDALTVTNVALNPAATAGSTEKTVGTTTVTYQGTYTGTTLNSTDNNAWVVSNNNLYNVNSNVNVGAFRAYFTVDTTGEVKALKLNFGDTETGIGEIANGQSSNGQWYNLAGQRVNKAQKGIYIVNGKKVLVK